MIATYLKNATIKKLTQGIITICGGLEKLQLKALSREGCHLFEDLNWIKLINKIIITLVYQNKVI